MHHTYKRWTHVPGRKISWLIVDTEAHREVGAIGVAGGIMCARPRDQLIGWTTPQKLIGLRHVANNYRFALAERGIGSRALALLTRAAPREWKHRYGERLVLLESLVQPPYLGTCYRAAGWHYIGDTKGCSVRRLPLSLWRRGGGERGRLLAVDRSAAIARYAGWNRGRIVTADPSPPKLIFIKPLHRYWRRALLAGSGISPPDRSLLPVPRRGPVRAT